GVLQLLSGNHTLKMHATRILCVRRESPADMPQRGIPMPSKSLPVLPAQVAPVTASSRGVPAKPHGVPLLRLGFRPFYLCAAGFALLAIPLWIAMFLGWLTPDLAIAP